jgi:hypothetical protein
MLTEPVIPLKLQLIRKQADTSPKDWQKTTRRSFQLEGAEGSDKMEDERIITAVPEKGNNLLEILKSTERKYERKWKDRFFEQDWERRRNCNKVKICGKIEERGVIFVFAGPTPECIYPGDHWDPLKHRNNSWCTSAARVNKHLLSLETVLLLTFFI